MEDKELYTSGGFTKGPDSWLVYVNPASGQRPPQPGDWAQIIQRTKHFNRPVPVTLVDDMGGAWTFKNGHHPDIGDSIQNTSSNDERSHLWELQPKKRPRRPGQVPAREQTCLTPVDPKQSPQEPEPPVDPNNPEGYDFDDPRHPYWQ